MGCIELKGPYDQIVEGLMHHVNQDCGRTFKAKCYERGTREGSIFIYKYDAFPYEAIGKVSFFWDTCIQKEARTLWIWTEPSIYKQVADELQITFNLKQNDPELLEWEPPVLKKPKLVETTKYLKITETPEHSLCYVNGAIKMSLLKDTLNRLRLTGPLSNSVLSNLLYPADLINSSNHNEGDWWSSHLKNFKNSCNVQKELWESFSGANRPESYPSNCVIGFHTIDPRLMFPKKRTKALPSTKGILYFYHINQKNVFIPNLILLLLDFLLSDDYSLTLPTTASYSKIWDSTVRNWSTQNKMSNCKINTLRSEYVISKNDKIALDKHSMSVIPILLIQRPGQSQPIYRAGIL